MACGRQDFSVRAITELIKNGNRLQHHASVMIRAFPESLQWHLHVDLSGGNPYLAGCHLYQQLLGPQDCLFGKCDSEHRPFQHVADCGKLRLAEESVLPLPDLRKSGTERAKFINLFRILPLNSDLFTNFEVRLGAFTSVERIWSSGLFLFITN